MFFYKKKTRQEKQEKKQDPPMMGCNMFNVQQNSYLVVKMHLCLTRNHS